MYQPNQSLIDKCYTLVRSNGGWQALYARVGGPLYEAVKRMPNQVPCPLTLEGKTVFRFFKSDFTAKGGAYHNRVGALPDGIAVIRWYYRLNNLKETVDKISELFGESINNVHVNQAEISRISREERLKSIKEKEKRWKHIEQLYQQSSPASESDVIQKYLSNRGLSDIDYLPATLGYVDKCYYKESKNVSYHPAMLALFSDKEGRNLTIHRTYLDRFGHKASVESARKVMPPPGSMTGGAIRLYEPIIKDRTFYLALTEGIETALAVRILTDQPVWACYSDSLLRQVDIPNCYLPKHADIDKFNITIFADQDVCGAGEEAGKWAVLNLKNKLHAKYGSDITTDISVMLPNHPIPENSKSFDWADMLQKYGLENVFDYIN